MNLRKYLFRTSCAVLLLTIFACNEEFLETEPADSIPINISIIDEATLESSVLGIYAGMQSSATFGSDYFTVQAMLGDNGYVSVRNSNRFTDVNDYTHALVEGGRIAGVWNSSYSNLLNINNVLSFEGSIEDRQDVEGTPANRFGEAYVARATVLFQLVNWYARPPGSGIAQELGVVVPTEPVIGSSLPRSTVAETYAQIIADCERAIALMDAEPGVTRLGPTAAKLLLSRAYLYLEDYPNALNYANQVLNNSEGFSLLERANVAAYYASEVSPETLFQVEFNGNDNPGSNSAFTATWTLTGTYAQNFATREFYDLIPDTDARKVLYADNIPEETYSDIEIGVDVRKFVTLDRDMPHFRMSEAKLNQIEALYYINPNQARSELNSWVSNFRDPDYNTDANGQALLDEILKQRRIELAFEGHRFFDMNRYGMTVQKSPNCVNNCNIPFSDFRRVYPIPLQEMNTNQTGIQQNPGYN